MKEEVQPINTSCSWSAQLKLLPLGVPWSRPTGSLWDLRLFEASPYLKLLYQVYQGGMEGGRGTEEREQFLLDSILLNGFPQKSTHLSHLAPGGKTA